MSSLVPFNQRRNSLLNNGFFSMLNDFFPEGTISQQRAAFRIDIDETEDAYNVTAEMPGVEKGDITINMANGRLTIGVSKNEEKEESEKNYIHKERVTASYARSLYLPSTDAESIKAKLENGILSVSVGKKKKESDSPKSIEIE